MGDLADMDEAAARRLGLSAEGAPLVGRRIPASRPYEPFGEGGVLHRIGTDHGTAWSNPADGKVVASATERTLGRCTVRGAQRGRQLLHHERPNGG